LLLTAAVVVLREELVQDPVVEVLQLHLLRVRDAPARGRLGGGRRRRRPATHPASLAGEVEDGGGALLRECGTVVGARGLLGGVEGAEPDAGAAALRVPDLGRELAPRPLPHAAVLALLLVILHV
uniref:Uncharacterized protein n=1 Tax=Triticum urartu TaxID=4572 RepID=A0A8R7Q874_TRIUA